VYLSPADALSVCEYIIININVKKLSF